MGNFRLEQGSGGSLHHTCHRRIPPLLAHFLCWSKYCRLLIGMEFKCTDNHLSVCPFQNLDGRFEYSGAGLYLAVMLRNVSISVDGSDLLETAINVLQKKGLVVSLYFFLFCNWRLETLSGAFRNIVYDTCTLLKSLWNPGLDSQSLSAAQKVC